MSGERRGAADFTLKGVGTSGSSTARSGSNIRRSSPLSSNVALQRDRSSPSRPTGWQPYILRGRVDSHAHDGLHRTFFKTGRVAEIFLGTNKSMRDRTATSASHRRKHDEGLQDPSRAAKESHRDQITRRFQLSVNGPGGNLVPSWIRPGDSSLQRFSWPSSTTLPKDSLYKGTAAISSGRTWDKAMEPLRGAKSVQEEAASDHSQTLPSTSSSDDGKLSQAITRRKDPKHMNVFLPAFSNETRQERRVAARGNEEEFQSDSEETHSSRMDSPLTQPDLLECDDDGDSQDSRDLQMEENYDEDDESDVQDSGRSDSESESVVDPGEQDVDQLLDEVAAADVSGLKGRVWHSCFFGRPPSLHFLHDWYHNAGEVKSGDEDEKKEEGRKQEEATEETISESWSKKDGTSSWEDAWKDSRGRDLFSLLQEKGWMKLKMTNKSSQARRAHENAGYAVLRKDQNPTAARTSHFNCWWAHALSPHDSRWKKLQAHQKVNHFPGTFCIGRKDRLTRNLMRFKRRVGKDKCDFYPSTYILPASYTEFKNDFQSSKGVWIWKPCASARGIGIKIVTRLEQVSKKKPGLIQEYINSPLLINGFKFDLRVYVLATSFNPLKLYIFTNGLVRFSTKKYKRIKKNSKAVSRFMHLTNYSVNKKSSSFQVRSDADMDAWTGSKWSIRALWRYLREELDYTQERVDKVWSDIRSVILRTFIAAESHININTSLLHLDRSNCFELWGVDILLDSALKPWLVEVNTSPDLSASSPLDKEIKGSLFTDTFTIVGAEVVKQKKHHGRSRDPQPETRVRPTGSADESRRKPSNNLQTTSTSWFSDLTPLDIQVLQQSEDEFRRQESTQFEILYPHPSMCEIYEPMFESSRSLNRLLHHWVKCRENPPPRLCELLDMKPSALHTRREEPQVCRPALISATQTVKL